MSEIPFRAFLDLLTRGILQPRPVARAMIDAGMTRAERFMLVGVGAAMQGFFWAAISVMAPGLTGGSSGLGLLGQALIAVLLFVNYVVTATVAYNVGRRFGGKGSTDAVASAVAWHTVMSSALTPLQVVALGGAATGQTAGPLGALFALLYAGLNIYLLAACVAEAHDFRSTGGVAAATVGIFLVLGFAFSVLLAAISSA